MNFSLRAANADAALLAAVVASSPLEPAAFAAFAAFAGCAFAIAIAFAAAVAGVVPVRRTVLAFPMGGGDGSPIPRVFGKYPGGGSDGGGIAPTYSLLGPTTAFDASDALGGALSPCFNAHASSSKYSR